MHDTASVQIWTIFPLLFCHCLHWFCCHVLALCWLFWFKCIVTSV